MYRCPKCGSKDVRGQKTSLERSPASNPFSTLNFWEMYCFDCRTSESRHDDAAGFDEWYERWLAR